jgi:hypothetical protein
MSAAGSAGPAHAYTAVRVEGGLLTRDLLERIAAGDRDVPGNRPEDYHLAVGERLGEAASRHWDYLLGAYRAFRERLDRQSGGSVTTLTRERWLLVLLNELGFGRVPYVGGLSVGERTYPVSHLWGHVPIHLVGWDRDLDRRHGNGGKADRAPQSMVQEFLNASDAHLWGVLSNGRILRILRDSTTLVGSAYVEFDLEAIFEGELYADFVPLFALLHSSRFELPEGQEATPADCRLERWRTYAAETGVQAGNKLRAGVTRALEELGTGFLEANPELRRQLANGPNGGGISADDLRHELLRLAYQLIFLFVAEDRGVLLEPDPQPEPDETAAQRAARERRRADLQAARERYATYFSTVRLRRIAANRRGDRHRDLWRGLVIVLNALGADGGRPELALPELGGLYFRGGEPSGGGAAPDLLRDCELPNDRLLAAVRQLSETRDDKGRRQRVDFVHLGSVELGSVYESLLELDPRPDLVEPRFELKERQAGNERKTSGSYYTPTPLIDSLLDTALDPVIDEHAAAGIPDDLLKITVCDPACGSGHFLVAAARRIARRYAAMYVGDDEPSPEAVRSALGEVVRHCVYGVDINPLAAELAKVSLWLESLEPGRPLAFLDAHIKVGNSLLGVTPKLLEEGVPDPAYKPFGDDDPVVVRALKAENRKARDIGQGTLFGASVHAYVGNVGLATKVREITSTRAATLAEIREQARRYRELQDSGEKRRKTRVADAWCAAFVWPKRKDAPPGITTQTIRELDEGAEPAADAAEVLEELTARYGFFHWHLEFPEIFRVVDDGDADANPDTGWQGGFSCVLGNPPWERVKLQEKEFFATRHEGIAKAPNAANRKKMIEALAGSDDRYERELHQKFHAALRESAGWSQLLRDSGRYPLTGQGDVNTYAVFAETARTVIGPRGRSGLVLPTGIATDATTAPFFGDLIRNGKLAAFLEFENEEFILSRDVDHRVRFCLLSVCGRGVSPDEAIFAFGSRKMADVASRSFTMPPEEILLLNPNTGTTPVFRSRRDAEITLDIYRRVPVLWRESPESNPWQISFMRMFDMANDSDLFQTRDELELRGGGWRLEGNIFVRGHGKDIERMLPLYEAKMIHHFDHRLGTYEGQTEAQANMGTLPRITAEQHADPKRVVIPRYWVAEEEVDNRLAGRWDRGWLLGWRDIARSTDERTLIVGALGCAAVGHTFPLILRPDIFLAPLYANFATFILDYVIRQKLAGTHLTYGYLKQLPVLPPERYEEPVEWLGNESLARWVEERVLELTYTAWDMQPFARDLGDEGSPFVWDEERRFVMRAELDAAYFHLYGVARGDVDYIMDSFRAFRNNDPSRFARTKALILELYDAMAKAAASGKPYETPLDPPPGRGPRHPHR